MYMSRNDLRQIRLRRVPAPRDAAQPFPEWRAAEFSQVFYERPLAPTRDAAARRARLRGSTVREVRFAKPDLLPPFDQPHVEKKRKLLAPQCVHFWQPSV